jgi:hypothetical protein
MIQARIKNKYCFNMQVSARAMTLAENLFQAGTPLGLEAFKTAGD